MKSRNVSKKSRMLGYRRRLKKRAQPQVFWSYNFSDVEDSPEAFEKIKQLAAKAGESAAAEAKAAGLSRIFARNNQIIRLYPDGKEEVVVTSPPRGSKFYIYYKPATVFHAGKK